VVPRSRDDPVDWSAVSPVLKASWAHYGIVNHALERRRFAEQTAPEEPVGFSRREHVSGVGVEPGIEPCRAGHGVQPASSLVGVPTAHNSPQDKGGTAGEN